MAQSSVRAGDSVRLTLYWQALSRTSRNLTVFAHALDGSGILRGQKDSLPRGGTLPTDRWLPTEIVTDARELVIQKDAPAGEYQLEVGCISPRQVCV